MIWMPVAVLALAAPTSTDAVLLEFHADWCGPCRQMTSTIDEIERRGYPVRRVNVDTERALADRYHADRLPCFVMVAGGREVDRVVGLTSYNRLVEMFHKASLASTPPPPPPAKMPSRMPAAPLPALASGPLFTTAAPGQVLAPGSELLASGNEPAMPNVAAAIPVSVRPAEVAPADGSSGRGLAGSAAVPATNAQLIAASVRLRIEDPDGHSCGSGTIIDARQGWALVLTCGHIFRDSKGKGRIEVDLFTSGRAERVVGELVSRDEDRDVGLLRIRTSGPVAVARVAPRDFRVSVGDPVASVGCDNGADPTVQHTRVRSKDRFLGPPNLQTDGLPVEGRSGGGLFSQEGWVIGVCNAADPKDQQGLFAALASIHAELDRAGLSYVYQQPAEAASREPLVAVAPPAMPNRMPPSEPSSPASEGAIRPTASRSLDEPAVGAGPLSAEERAALAEIARRKAEGAEVICIIRSRDNPTAKSEVFVLEKASPSFLRELGALAPGGLPSAEAAVPAGR